MPQFPHMAYMPRHYIVSWSTECSLAPCDCYSGHPTIFVSSPRTAVSLSVTKCVIPEALSILNTLYYSDSRRKIQGTPREALSINATYHDHSLDFQCWTSNFSADSGILMMQEIVLRFSCDCFLRMLSCKEIWKSGAQLCGILPWDAYGWDGLMLLWDRNWRQLLGPEGLLKLPLPTSSCAGSWELTAKLQASPLLWSPAPLFSYPTPPLSGLNLVCELAPCPVHYAQVWLLVITWPRLCDWWESPPQFEACLLFL